MRPVLLAIALAACSFPKPADVGPSDATPGDGTTRDRPGDDASDLVDAPASHADANIDGGSTTSDGQTTPPMFTSFSFQTANNPTLPHDLVGTLQLGSVDARLFGTPATLKPTFAVSPPGATVTVGGQQQTSGVSAQNFTSAVTYTVKFGGVSTPYSVQVHSRKLVPTSTTINGQQAGGALAVGDVDGDGRPDVVVGLTTSAVWIYQNMTPTTSVPTPTSFATPVIVATSEVPAAVLLVDLDGDHRPELIVVGTSGASLEVFRNVSAAGAPMFLPTPTKFDFGATPRGVAAGDLNGDGLPDLVVVDESINKVNIRFNITPQNGMGAFAFGPTLTLNTGSGPVAVAISELDGNNKPDLVVANHFGGTVSVIQNATPAGATSFTGAAGTPITTIPAGPRAFAAADFDSDSKMDLLLATDGAASFTSLRNTGTTYTPTPVTTTANTISVAAFDLDADAHPDALAVTASTSNSASWAEPFVQGTNGTPVAQTVVNGSLNAMASATGDLDGNGLTDLVVLGDKDFTVFALVEN